MSCVRRSAALVAAVVTLAPASRVEQRAQGTRPALTVLESFDGLGVGMTPGPGTNNPPQPRNPSDNSIAVGPDHIVQTVNSQVAIFSKKGARYATTGETLYGPVSTNTFFAGFGGVCEARPNGDAVVRYDQLADRWLVVMPIFRRTVFPDDRSHAGDPARPHTPSNPGPAAKPGPPPPLPAPEPRAAAAAPAAPAEGTYAICYAISTTSDPLGPYFRYAFERPLFPDYPRPAVWPDGYYVATSTGDDVVQKHACAVEREKMLRGEPAREQCIVVDGVNFLNTADVEGRTPPPPGAPNIVMAAGGTQLKGVLRDNRIFAWQFRPDWKTPLQTALVGRQVIHVAPYEYLCGGQLTKCVPQPDTDTRLDAQGDKLMARLVYRNIDGRESLVAVHSVNTSAGGGGVRWYEFSVNRARWVRLVQQGTLAPDALYRWMASPAIDARGNIVIGYSFGGPGRYPGQRIAARAVGDPRGLLTFGETVLVEGEASQTTTIRWEDYAQTAIDPSDDCTVWYAGDYVKKSAPSYSTRIGSVRVPGCTP